MRRQSTMFERMLEAMGNTADVMLRYQYQKDMFKESLLDRQEREKLKEEIIQEVVSRVSVVIDEQAIKQLDEMLRNLGK